MTLFHVQYFDVYIIHTEISVMKKDTFSSIKMLQKINFLVQYTFTYWVWSKKSTTDISACRERDYTVIYVVK